MTGELFEINSENSGAAGVHIVQNCLIFYWGYLEAIVINIGMHMSPGEAVRHGKCDRQTDEQTDRQMYRQRYP